LSVAVVAQYGLAPLVHKACPSLQMLLHLPPLHRWPAGQTLPQAPQLLLSLDTEAQYG
jgi:hypothetical protein